MATPDPTDIDTAKIKKVQEDGRMVEFRDPKTGDDAAKIAAANVAKKKPHLGLFMRKCVPPGPGT